MMRETNKYIKILLIGFTQLPGSLLFAVQRPWLSHRERQGGSAAELLV